MSNEIFTAKYSEFELFCLFIIVIYQHLRLSTYNQKTVFKSKMVDDNSVVYYYRRSQQLVPL